MTETYAIPDYTVVDEDQLLQLLVTQWQDLRVIAIDTEFIRTNTFYPRAGLIQVATEDARFLIDPLAIRDVEPLKALLQNPNVIKVLHSCSEDLEMFDSYLGILPEPIFDTQLAGAFLNRGLSVSYKNIVLEMFGEDLPKGEQRSDWLQRPLTNSQLDYAVLDVEFLLDIYVEQRTALEESGKLGWLEEECERLLAKQRAGVVPSEAYGRVKSAWRLKPQELSVLQRLAQWRELEAKHSDMPRGFLLRDPALMQIAQQQPDSIADLKLVEGIHPRIIRKYGERILSLVEQDNTDELISDLRGPLSRSLGEHVKTIKSWIDAQAARMDISPELMMNRKTINALVYSLVESDEFELPADMSLWKQQAFGDGLLELLKGIKERLR